MNLFTLTAPLRQDYDFLQVQIETIQERQRQILEKIQGIEDKVKVANLALKEAIAAVRDACPEQLAEYQQSVNELFETKPTVEIETFVEPEPAEEMVEVATVTVDGTAVSVESIEDNEPKGEHEMEEIIVHLPDVQLIEVKNEAQTEEPKEAVEQVTNGQVYLSVDELKEIGITKLRSLATGYGKIATGNKLQLATRLEGFVTKDDVANLV